MSYDVELCDPVTREVLRVDPPHHLKGGPDSELSLNVTYNYTPHLSRVLTETMHGLRSLGDIYGMTGADTIPIFREAIALLADDADADYFKATEGNAKRALCQLLAMAQMRPDGVWRVT